MSVNEDSGLFPPLPEELEAVFAGQEESLAPRDYYTAVFESICGAVDDSQPVEQYDGTLGVTTAFVAAHQQPVGQLQWNDDLASKYTNPGNVSGVRWCTGTMISDNLFLTAGHCFDQTGGGWQRPRINGTNDIIPVEEIAANMHINFNYQVDSAGVLRQEVRVEIEALVEYRLGGLDFAIVRLAGTPGQTFGIGTLATEDASVQDMLCIIGHPAGVPKRIEAGPLTALAGNQLRYNDIDTLGGNSGSAVLHSPSGLIVGIHTNGGCNTQGFNFGLRISSLLAASPTLRSIIQPDLSLVFRQGTYTAAMRQPGLFTLRQKSNGRFLDAHQNQAKDFSVVTRRAQNNDTQRWTLTPVALVCTLQQQSNGRFLDAHQNQGNDFSVVTRTAQNNATQEWLLTPLGNDVYTLQQRSNGRFLDAHESQANDFSVVTRNAQNNDTQRWQLTSLGDGVYTLQQQSNGRFLDAHANAINDFSVVTRTAQNNDTQRWQLTLVGGIYTAQQQSSGRFLDAHENAANDFSVVTRSFQHNDTQRWLFTYFGQDLFAIQQLSNGRFLDAHQNQANDFSVVTRNTQNNDTQQWVVKPVLPAN